MVPVVERVIALDGAPAGGSQFDAGVKYTDQAATKKIAPATVGVHLLTGSLAVVKDVTGDAAGYAPAALTADVSCVIGSTVIDLGGNIGRRMSV